MQEVVVTGSRIPRNATLQGASVIVPSADDLDAQGFRNVYDALNEQTQNTSFTQGADFGNTFTPAANAISLRGLGPNLTLVLISAVRVIVNNLFDTVTDDPSFGWPYYPVGNYTPYGRQYWLEMDYRFGG